VLKLDRACFCLLSLLVGCSTGTQTRVSDWNATDSESEMALEHVTEGPVIAPPPETSISPSLTNRVPAGTWISLEHWSRDNNAGRPLTQLSPGPTRAFSLATSNGLFVINAGSLSAKWEGAEFRLGFEPQIINDQPFVHSLDLEKNIEPLLRGSAPLPTNRVIVIDPGHGGGNGGTKSILNGANEKEFTLDWALRMAPLMASNGWTVFLTRTNDVEMSLAARVAFADDRRADLFVSLHFNSVAPRQEHAGLETFCLTPAGMRSTLTREYEDDATAIFANNAFDAGNLQYAMRIHRGLLKECDFYDRGVRRARFLGVLRGQNRPAVLLEAGYLSNPAEAARIATPEFRQKLAEAVARALK
jgi:N-acetylmuramoyl-L-alanine amidase